MSDSTELRNALRQIAEIAANASGAGSNDDNNVVSQDAVPICTPKPLPKERNDEAAKNAVSHNPMNAPQMGPMADVSLESPITSAKISVLTSKYWGTDLRKLSVSFMESTPQELRTRIISHLNAWSRLDVAGLQLTLGSIEFVETSGIGDVRISRGAGGYWSYLGTDIRLIPDNEPTMNLQGFTMNTSEAEFRRVVRHEAGHTLGFPHEHMRADLIARIDREKAYTYFWNTQRWDRDTVDQQVLTPLNENSLMGTPVDQTSIMCYQLPGSITVDGNAITGGDDINETDSRFAFKIYPVPNSPFINS